MSLPLSGQLGLAQLGAAELGQLATIGVTGGFFPVMLGGGPAKEKKKKKKKVQKPKRLKLPKVRKPKPPKPVEPVIVETKPAPRIEVPPDTVIASEPFNTAEYLKLIDDVRRQERLRETIAEEDELLLLLIC